MRAIVAGVSGQDGYFMSKLLVANGYQVLGLSADLGRATAAHAWAPADVLQLVEFDYYRAGAIDEFVHGFKPDLIFNFAAKATGQGMFDAPAEMSRLNGVFPLDILEAIRTSGRADAIGFCQASSSEMFGHVTQSVQSEDTPFRPKSPYGAAKVYAHNLIGVYRTAFGVRACSAILYNHESVRRSTNFVTKKIAHGAAAIKAGKAGELELGPLDARRDWGYAPEYVSAMYLMATSDEPADYVVATGVLNSLQRVLEIAFDHVGLDYRNFVKINEAYRRPVESFDLCGDPSKIKRELGWEATTPIEKIITEMVDHELDLMRG